MIILNPAEALEVTRSLEGTPDVPIGYSEGFVRVRPDGSNRGSFVVGIDDIGKTKKLLSELPWRSVDRETLPAGACHPDKNVSYFRAELPQAYAAKTGVIALQDADLGKVELVEGKHGMEFSMPATGELPLTAEVWAVIGPIGEKIGLWTWYPGPIAVFATARHKELLARWFSEGRGSLTSEEIRELGALSVKLRQA
jgi:hypothetical protein